MAKLKISADTTELKKSLLGASRDIKALGASKISIMSEKERKFFKQELSTELSAIKNKLKLNRIEIKALVDEQKKMVKSSKEELENRKKVIDAIKIQSKLSREYNTLQTQKKGLGSFGGMGGSGVGGVLGKVASVAGKGLLAGGLAALAYGALRTLQSGSQFSAGAANRVRLRGLGIAGSNFGSPAELARAGLTEQDMIQRQVGAVSRLGRSGGSRTSLMRQAQFERSMGLEGGSLLNVSTGIRGQFGGRGADQAQQKIQATILASGIEDALAPYLESMTSLLSTINENGVTNTDEMISLFSRLVKDGSRTPEQISQAISGIDSAVRDATGEANAFFQNAFARAGIGGGSIGATRLALSSSGIFGLSADELKRRNYNPELIANLQGQGFMQGVGGRTGAVLDQFKRQAGMNSDQSLNEVKDVNTMVGLSQLANSVFGTKGVGGFDALKLLEDVQGKRITQEQFQKRVEEMRADKDPQARRLDTVNETLAGQLTVQEAIRDNLMEALGKRGGAQIKMLGTEADIQGIKGTSGVVGAVNDTGVFGATREGIGSVGDKLYSWMFGSEEQKNSTMSKFGELPRTEMKPENPITEDIGEMISKAMERGMSKVLDSQRQKTVIPSVNNEINVKIRNGDGKISNKTHR